MNKKTLSIHRQGEFHWVGDGFPVRSAFSYDGLGREQLSPFLMLDYAAPYDFKPGTARRGVGAHPHKGFETVTIAYQGELEHRDSMGGGGKIGPGDVQWMTAGSGLLHDEFHSDAFTKSGGTFEMVQLWLNLKAADKSAKPGYQAIEAGTIPTVNLPDDAGNVRLIAGDYGGKKGPAKTFTSVNLWNVELKADKKVELPLGEGHSAAVLLRSGEVLAGTAEKSESGKGDDASGNKAVAGDLIVFTREGNSITLEARKDSALLLLSGEPINEPVFGYGPFVMNTVEEIQQAMHDFRAGKMGNLE